MSVRLAIALLLLALGCATPPIGGSVDPPHDPAAEAILRGWVEATQGSDALEAWELLHEESITRFGVARRRESARVDVLTWVIEPTDVAVRAFMLRATSGWNAELQWAISSGDTGRRLTVRRSRAPPSNPGRFDAFSVGAEVVVPIFPEDFGHVRLADDALAGQACRVIESRPRRRLRAYTHVRRCIAVDPPRVLRTVYYAGERELRRIEAEPHGEDRPGPRFSVRTADGKSGRLVRRNAVAVATLPASLFSKLTLETQRFPGF